MTRVENHRVSVAALMTQERTKMRESNRKRWQCAAGHQVELRLDSGDEPTVGAVIARRQKNKTCEVGVGGGRVCGAALAEVTLES